MLRKLLISTVIVLGATGVAAAADLPTQKGPPVYAPPPPLFTWTGVYIGGQVGYQWGTASTSLYGPAGYTGSLPNISPSGVTGGGHIGYNYQIGQFVVGLEGDVDGSSYNGSNLGGLGTLYSQRELVEGSVRGRVGYAWDRALIYATGGAAFGDFQNNYTFGPTSNSLSTTRVGWTVGGGVEYAIDNNWSVRAEYRYTDFGRYYLTPSAIAVASGGASKTTGVRDTDNRVQVGFSYKFDLGGPIPVAAKY